MVTNQLRIKVDHHHEVKNWLSTADIESKDFIVPDEKPAHGKNSTS